MRSFGSIGALDLAGVDLGDAGVDFRETFLVGRLTIVLATFATFPRRVIAGPPCGVFGVLS
jgi:hypothetical protein